MEYWATRDKDGFLALWDVNDLPPVKNVHNSAFISTSENHSWFMISSRLLPEVTWENSPVKVELKIKQ